MDDIWDQDIILKNTTVPPKKSKREEYLHTSEMDDIWDQDIILKNTTVPPKKSKREEYLDKKIKAKKQLQNRIRYKEIKRNAIIEIKIEKEFGEQFWYSSCNGISDSK